MVTAYLNGEIDNEVYFKLLPICGDDASLVCQMWNAFVWSSEGGTTLEQGSG